MQTWDSELPQTMQSKLSLLLEQRQNLKQQEYQLKQKDLLLVHKKSLSRLQNQNQQTVETLLENEKTELIDILDQELITQNQRQYSSRRMPTLEQSAISFQEQSAVFHKSNKTNRSASTNISYFNTQSPQRLSKFKVDNNTSRIQDQDQTIKQLQSLVAEQQEKSLIQNQEIQMLKEQNQTLTRYTSCDSNKIYRDKTEQIGRRSSRWFLLFGEFWLDLFEKTIIQPCLEIWECFKNGMKIMGILNHLVNMNRKAKPSFVLSIQFLNQLLWYFFQKNLNANTIARNK